MAELELFLCKYTKTKACGRRRESQRKRKIAKEAGRRKRGYRKKRPTKK